MTTLRLSARAFASHLPDRWFSPASVALGVVGLAYVPLLMVYARELWSLADYRFFPLLIIAALAVSARRWRDVASVEPGRVVWAAPIAAIALALLTFAILLDSPRLAVVSALLLLPAAIYALAGIQALRACWPGCALLWMGVRLPWEGDLWLLRAFEHGCVRAAHQMLDAAGVLHVAQGNAIEIPGQLLLADQASQGPAGFLLVLALTLSCCAWFGRGPVHTTCLTLLAGIWSLLGNVLRIVLIAVSAGTWSAIGDSGVAQAALGLLVLALTLWVIWSTDQFFVLLRDLKTVRLKRKKRAKAAAPFPVLTTIPRETPAEPTTLYWPSRPAGAEPPTVGLVLTPDQEVVIVRSQAPASTPGQPTRLPDISRMYRRPAWHRSQRLAVSILGIAYGLLLVGQVMFAWPQRASAALLMQSADASLVPSSESLPNSWRTWTRDGFELRPSASTIYGAALARWSYRVGERRILISLVEESNTGDLADDVRGLGWTVEPARMSSETRTSNDGQKGGARKTGDAAWVEQDLFRPERQLFGFLLGAEHSLDGKSVSMRRGGSLDFLDQRMSLASSLRAGVRELPISRVRLLLTSYAPITEADRAEARDFFREALRRLSSLPADASEAAHE
jgi:hypothetical protein